MGKGDKRSRRGKIYRGSHGKTRSHGPRRPKSDATTTKDTTRKPLRPLSR